MTMMNILFINLFLFVFVNIVYADLKLCKWKDLEGICIPTDDCFGECVKSELCLKDICCLYPYIVQKKCYDYQQVAYEKFYEPLNVTENKIIGGELARKNEFPFMAAIGYEMLSQISPGTIHKGIEWFCGGSVISHEFILTAAHCYLEDKKIWALVGTNNLDDPEGMQLEVSQFIKHPEYTDSSHFHDIALLKLMAPLHFSQRVQPACLLFEEEKKYTTAIAAGWGKTDEGELDILVNELREVKLRVIYLKECKKYHTVLVKYNSLTNAMICAGQISGGKDTCQGDSGGPLVIPLKENSKFYGIVGITSTSMFGCGAPNSPSIYTRISYYLTWITEIVWPNEC